MDQMIFPALAGLVGIIIGLIIAKFSEKSKANKILDATKKETNSLLKEAKIEAEALKKDKILQAKEKFIELKSEHEKVILNREKKISDIEKRTRDKESQVQSEVDKTKRLNASPVVTRPINPAIAKSHKLYTFEIEDLPMSNGINL